MRTYSSSSPQFPLFPASVLPFPSFIHTALEERETEGGKRLLFCLEEGGREVEWDGGEGRKEEKGEGGRNGGKEASHPGTSFSFFLPSPSSPLLRVCECVTPAPPSLFPVGRTEERGDSICWGRSFELVS